LQKEPWRQVYAQSKLPTFKQAHWLPHCESEVLSPNCSSIVERATRWLHAQPEFIETFPNLYPCPFVCILLKIEKESPGNHAALTVYFQQKNGPSKATAANKELQRGMEYILDVSATQQHHATLTFSQTMQTPAYDGDSSIDHSRPRQPPCHMSPDFECITRSQAAGGKIIVCGVGKSGLVGRKTVATLKSLSIAASFMHAAEAAHGDLGDIREHDVLFFISYSGKTPELLNLLPHLPRQLQIVALTSQSKASECPLLKEHENGILLPAPLFELEEVSFGVSAPTTSTTVQIAIGDMLALTVADQLHENKGKTFKKNHPGGAIGAVTRESAKSIADARQQPVAPLEVVPLELPSPSLSAQSDS
ncbi:sugar isomerase, partial [Aureobasidium melanogenum]